MHFITDKIHSRKGFTLAELMIVVGIVIVLLAVSIPAVFTIQKHLRQTELDNKAETVFVSVQNRLTKLKSSGFTEAFDKTAGGVQQITTMPGDITEADNIEEGSLYYFTSETLSASGSAAEAVMTADVMDTELLDYHWVIEYNPETAIVYAVFYSENKGNCAEEYGSASNLQLYNIFLRMSRSNRIEDGARIGYYGGGSGKSSSTTSQLHPTATCTNNEKLTLSVRVTCPTGVSDYPVIRVNLTDGDGNDYDEYFAFFGCSQDYISRIEQEAADSGVDHINYELLKKEGTNEFTLELVLDDLSSSSTRFASQYKDLTPGTSLQIEVSALCPGNRLVKEGTASTINTNSLFADSSTDDTAYIEYGRHLQNLDTASGVTADITKAKQNVDLCFSDQDRKTGLEDWYETYSENGFFNHTTADGDIAFKPITNAALVSYDGNNHIIKGLSEQEANEVGLFAVLYGGQTVSNLRMTGTKLKTTATSGSTAAGAIAGRINAGTGAAVIENCQVYLTDDERQGKDNHNVWLSAKYAGGLVGRAEMGSTLTITQSAASTVIGSYSYTESAAGDGRKNTTVTSISTVSAGGLVGFADTSTSVSITGSYADNYLVGRYAGGLVGISEAASTVTGSYAAGYLTYSVQGAGMVLGSAQMDHAYTLMYLNYMSDDNVKPYYRTAKSGTVDTVYYAADHVGCTVDLGEKNLQSYTISQLKDSLSEDGKASFTDKTGNSVAYNLMGQTLSKYTYPALTNVKHYGDWQADFQSGALVYYEKYVNTATNKVSYGFYGANVDSTLQDDPVYTVVGDGYGIVYKDNTPEKVTVTITDTAIQTNTCKQEISLAAAESYEVDADDSTYYIYPLDVDKVNNWSKPSSAFYLKAVVQASTGTRTENADYYYFNPHFAKTVVQVQEDDALPDITSDTMIAVRTARHLYMMSLYYDTYAAATRTAAYKQERNIDYADYDWSNFSTRADKDSNPRSQAPIAGNAVVFSATYDGACNYITNVSFITETGKYVGLFGRSSGTIRNCVLRADYDPTEGAANYYVARTGSIKTNDNIYMGIIVGINEAGGVITNCSTDGYYVAGRQATIFAYENSNLFIGGIAGQNRGTITSSAADVPKIRVSSTFANIRMAGLTGSNTGTISDCYALGSLEVALSRGGDAVAAGFTAVNSGVITSSYCAMALTAVGEAAETCGFAPAGGRIQNCQYLDKCSFQYVGTDYSVDDEDETAVSASFSDLSVESGAAGTAVYSYAFGELTPSEESYPFRAVVRNAAGQRVHYGDWMTKIDLGTVGFFYWEHETSGQNNGYHLTYIAETEQLDGTKKYLSGSTLCNAHSDGGVISEYGYGYFTEKDADEEPEVTSEYIGDLNDSSINEAASEAFETQMSGYDFVAYTTKDPFNDASTGIWLDVSSITDTDTKAITTQGSITVNGNTFSFTPFFANSMSCSTFSDTTVTDRAGNTANYSVAAGTSGHQYEIRSAAQLQYLNWNNSTAKADEYLRKDTGWFTKDGSEDTDNRANANVKSFPYLGYAYASETSTILHHAAGYYWRQTHDLDARSSQFTPIGSAYDSMQSTSNNNTYLYTAFFNGIYVGDSYTISNLQINSQSQTVGLFGVTIDARIDGVILYSDQDNVIQTNSAGKGFYNLGCLAGMAVKGSKNWLGTLKTGAGITNCSVSGYILKDARANDGYGGANVGGLIGLCTVDITECSAVVDTRIEVTYSRSDRYVRVGGLVGSFRGSTLQNCYAGGSIEEPFLANSSNATLTMVGGLANVGFLRTAGNLNSLFGSYTDCPTFSNCYVYTDLSSIDRSKSCVSALCPVVSTGNREHKQVSQPTYKEGPGTFADVSNCYYYSTADVTYKNRNADVGVYTDATSAQTDVADCAMRLTYDELAGNVKLGEDPLSYDAVRTSACIGKTIDEALGTASWSWVTVTEGNNQPINGKYSYPGSDLSLEGMNYPFPTVITQKDLVFGGTVNVHYGSWPLKGSYWENGRDAMDIFGDMVTDDSDENAGYAVKVFKLYASKSVPDISDFAVDTKNDEDRTDGEVLRAEVIRVGAQSTDENGTYYPVSIRACNTGTAKIIYVDDENGDAAFSLEITANIYAVSSLSTMELTTDKEQSFQLETVSEVAADGQAASTAKHFETDTNGEWVETVNQNNILSLNGTTISTRGGDSGAKESVTLTPADGTVSCTVERAGLGDSVISSTFTYQYHTVMVWSTDDRSYVEDTDDDSKPVPLTFQAVGYVEVNQPDMLGLSDSNSYQAAYITDQTALSPVKGEERTYQIEIPAVSGSDCFLYLRSDGLKLGTADIQSVYVSGVQAELQDGEYVAGDENEAYHVSFTTHAADDTYQYLTGSVVCRTTGSDLSEKRNVTLRVVVRINGIDYDLTISLKKVNTEKQILLTCQDGSGHSIEKQLLTGNIVLPYENDSSLSAFETPRFQRLTGWRNTETNEVLAPGATCKLTGNVTFQAVYDYIEPVLNANGGMFDDYEDTLTITWSMFDDQSSGTFSIEPYSTGTKNGAVSNHAVLAGYHIIGWHTSPTLSADESPAYAVDAVISLEDPNLIAAGYQLYAIWAKDE